MRKSITLLYLLLFLSAFLIASITVQAEESVGFSVQAQLPENQLNENHSYFDLRMEPGQEQKIQTIVYNHENEEITVQVSVYNASTNSNGLVVYEEQEEIDPSLENPVTEIATLDVEELTIPGGESKTVTTTLTMPEDPFDGMKLGGLHFEKVPEEEEATDSVNIQNKYAYVIGLQLTENDDEVIPDLHLQSVEPTLVNHRTAVVANLQNSKAVLIGNLSIIASVFEENGTEPMKEVQRDNFNMAPNSNIDFVIDWENKALQEGNYRIELKAYDGENEWEWKEDFSISEEAEILNQDAVELEEEDNSAIWYVTGIVVLVGIIIVLLVYIRKLKQR